MPHKSRKQKATEYETKYGNIPVEYNQRMSWLYDKLHLTQAQMYDIMMTQSQMVGSLNYYDINVVLFEVPEGSPRPRFRIVNRQNLANMAIANPSFVHVYSITGAEDNKYMRRLVDAGELQQLDSLICTPCNVDICAYMKTPSSFNKSSIITSGSTYSPWIYHELQTSKIIRHEPLSKYRTTYFAKDEYSSALEQSGFPKIKYDVTLDHLISIDMDILNSWGKAYSHEKCHYALDKLYAIVGILST